MNHADFLDYDLHLNEDVSVSSSMDDSISPFAPSVFNEHLDTEMANAQNADSRPSSPSPLNHAGFHDILSMGDVGRIGHLNDHRATSPLHMVDAVPAPTPAVMAAAVPAPMSGPVSMISPVAVAAAAPVKGTIAPQASYGRVVVATTAPRGVPQRASIAPVSAITPATVVMASIASRPTNVVASKFQPRTVVAVSAPAKPRSQSAAAEDMCLDSDGEDYPDIPMSPINTAAPPVQPRELSNEQMEEVWNSRGHEDVRVPQVNGRPILVGLLMQCVKDLGGFSAVQNNQKWAVVAEAVGFPLSDKSALSNLRQFYAHHCRQYERPGLLAHLMMGLASRSGSKAATAVAAPATAAAAVTTNGPIVRSCLAEVVPASRSPAHRPVLATEAPMGIAVPASPVTATMVSTPKGTKRKASIPGAVLATVAPPSAIAVAKATEAVAVTASLPSLPVVEKKARSWRSGSLSSTTSDSSYMSTQRFFLLHRDEENSLMTLERKFTVSDENGRFYVVVVGHNSSCTCAEASNSIYCDHISFVESKVLRNDRSAVVGHDDMLNLPGMFRTAAMDHTRSVMDEPALRRDYYRRSEMGSAVSRSSSAPRQKVTADSCCPICFDLLGSESITYCKAKCGANVHEACLSRWFSYLHRVDAPSETCPACKAQWKHAQVSSPTGDSVLSDSDCPMDINMTASPTTSDFLGEPAFPNGFDAIPDLIHGFASELY